MTMTHTTRSIKEIAQQWEKDRRDSGWHEIEGFPKFRINMWGEILRTDPRKMVKIRVGYEGKYAILRDAQHVQTAVLLKNLMAKHFPDRPFVDEVLPPRERKKYVQVRPPKPEGEPKWDQVSRTDQSDIPIFEGEEWRDIPGFEKYEASNYARFRFKTTKRILSKGRKTTRINLSRDGKSNNLATMDLMERTWGHLGLPRPKTTVE